MKKAFWRHWLQSLFHARPRLRTPGRISRRRILNLEAVEDRTLPSGTPTMVLDINAVTWSSYPSELVAVGSTTYFVADDGIHGKELWKSDGTVTGTVMVKDIRPGSDGAFFHNGYYQNDWLTNVNGTLFFTATDGDGSWRLWKSDGTEAGTVPLSSVASSPNNLTDVNGTLYFSAYTDTTGSELWKSNGTAAGTVIVKDIKPSWEGSNPRELTNVNGTLFFSIYDYSRTYSELWKSDGTSAGTILVKNFDPQNNDNTFPRDLTNVNGTLFFSAYTNAAGAELWKTNGTTSGTVLVKDIVTGTGGSYPNNLTNVNGTLYFSNVFGQGLWKSDGTAAGTVLVKDVHYPSHMTNVNGTIYFTGPDYETNGGYSLWKSDGTVAGTVVVKGNSSGIASGPIALTNVNGTLYFVVVHSNVNGTPTFDNTSELWKSDGTAAGTVLVTDLNSSGAYYGNPYSLTNVNGTLFFAAGDLQHGTELWKSDGTAAGTSLVKDISTNTAASNPRNMIDVNGTMFFTADDGVHGMELWKSDGTAAGTSLVKDIYPGSSSSPGNLTIVNGALFFTASDASGGSKLWKSDGTEAGTVPVSPLWYPRNLTAVNETLFFTTDDGVRGQELWKSDGTVAGTTIVKDIYPGGQWVDYGGYYGSSWRYVLNSSSPGNLTNVNGTLFFTASDDTNGRELWKSDGTEAGTALVKDIQPGMNSGSPQGITNVNGTMYFSAQDGVSGYELWKSDGTAAGTARVKDINSGGGSYPRYLTDFNGVLFFSASNGTNGDELWKSDGTAAGTVQITDINPGSASSSPSNMTIVDGTLFFPAYNDSTGSELWKSDGTSAGTVLVKDISPGSAWSLPRNLTNVNGTLFFTTAIDGKLWQSNGTAAGTVLVSDLIANSLTNVNDTLFFAADDGIHGTELWKIDPDFTAPPSIAITNVSRTEGNSGTSIAQFTVSLSAASTEAITVQYSTANGTASAGSDYQAASGTITFAPGETTKSVSVTINGDRAVEPNETFFVNLGNSTNAIIADAQGAGTIVDDEPRISIDDVTKFEGRKKATTKFTFLVTLSVAYDQPVTMSFQTVNGSARTGNNDYVAQTGTLTFAPGETVKKITIEVNGDAKRESDEYFYVGLFDNSSNSLFTKSRGIGTIVNDD